MFRGRKGDSYGGQSVKQVGVIWRVVTYSPVWWGFWNNRPNVIHVAEKQTKVRIIHLFIYLYLTYFQKGFEGIMLMMKCQSLNKLQFQECGNGNFCCFQFMFNKSRLMLTNPSLVFTSWKSVGFLVIYSFVHSFMQQMFLEPSLCVTPALCYWTAKGNGGAWYQHNIGSSIFRCLLPSVWKLLSC